MKAESLTFLGLALFFAIVAPVYWVMSHEPAGTAALILTTLLLLMIGGYLALIARKMDPRPEDRKDGEILEGAGELGFFPPHSLWPFICALTFGLVILGPVFGWWLTILGFGFGAFAVMGWIFEYYRGEFSH